MTADNTALHRRLITPQERYRLPAGAKQLITENPLLSNCQKDHHWSNYLNFMAKR